MMYNDSIEVGMESPMPVFVSNDHNHALENLHWAIRRGILPFEGITLIHVDSHPDLVSDGIAADMVMNDLESLYDAVDIAAWLLPAVYAGHVDTMVWLRPGDYCNQIASGVERFLVGRHADTGRLVTTSHARYFADDGLFAKASELDKNAPQRLLTLHVVSLDDANMLLQPGGPIWKDREAAQEVALWIDIDLDFFSVQNPFFQSDSRLATKLAPRLGWSHAEIFLLVRKLFVPEFAKDPCEGESHDGVHDQSRLSHSEYLRLRKQFNAQLASMLTPPVTADYASWRAFENEFWPQSTLSQPNVIDTNTQSSFVSQVIHLLLAADDNDLDELRRVGEVAELPEHVSSSEDITQLALNLKSLFVADRAIRPRIVTIAQSAGDYLLMEQLDTVQMHTIRILEDAYGTLDVRFDTTAIKDVDNLTGPPLHVAAAALPLKSRPIVKRSNFTDSLPLEMKKKRKT